MMICDIYMYDIRVGGVADCRNRILIGFTGNFGELNEEKRKKEKTTAKKRAMK